MTRRTLNLEWQPRWQPFLFAEGDGGGDGGGTAGNGAGAGGDGGSSASPPAPPTPNWTEWAENQLAGINNLNTNLGSKLDALNSQVTDLPGRMAPAPEPIDLDSMTRAQLVDHIVNTIGKQFTTDVNKALEPLVGQLTGLQQTVAQRQINGEIEGLKANHKDFTDWRSEMVDLAKNHPTLTVTQLYHLARAASPDKAKTLDAKYNPPSPPPPPRWSGLLGNTGSNGSQQPPLSREEAGREAYREVQQRHATVLRALEDI